MNVHTIAVLGLGSIGMRHALNLLAAGARVIGFDPDADRRDRFAANGSAVAESREAVLGEADAAVIASPSRYHLEDMAAAAEAGCHVLVEKPMSHTLKGLDDILSGFESRGLIVFAGLNLRFHPTVAKAKELLVEGRLGTLLWGRFQMSDYLPGWRPHQDYRRGYASDAVTGGVLFDVIHEFDLANHLLGPAEVETASARSSGLLEMASEDIADVILCHDGGVHSSLHLDYVTRPRQRRAEIAGTLGRMDIDLDARRLVIVGTGGDIEEDIRFPGSYDDDYRQEAELFLDCVGGRAPPPCDGREAFRVLEQVIAARMTCGLPQA